MNAAAIYLDYMATTPTDPRVIQKMLGYMGPEGIFANPASVTHDFGIEAARAIEDARETVAELLGITPRELIFTSGATESDNLALIGAARAYALQGKHIITVKTEHKAVLDSVAHLQSQGFDVTYLDVDSSGLVDTDELKAALRPDTILVSVMHVNNEIGVIQDIEAIGTLLRERGVLFHVDAAQSVGKLPIDLGHLPVDLMSFSGHKIYGPKGIGALYCRAKPRVRLSPISFGGSHEGGMRSGTLATHQIVGFAEALQLALSEREQEQTRLQTHRERIWKTLQTLGPISLNGHAEKRIAGNLNILFKGLDGESLRYAIKELAISQTSACTASSNKPSHVLSALGLNAPDIFSSIRLSIGRFTTEQDIERILAVLSEQVPRLYKMSAG